MSLCDPCKLLVDFLVWAEIYEPVIDIEEAQRRLFSIKLEWEKFQNGQRGDMSGPFNSPLSPFAAKSLSLFTESAADTRVAVDLGCGMGSTPYHLCSRGWRVYGVDSSLTMIPGVTAAVRHLNQNWIDNGQLKLVNSRIEDFEYPEKIDLIIATASFSYCDPSKITEIFHRARNALKEGGVFAVEFFAPNRELRMADEMMKKMFGAWFTTKNVIEAVAAFTGFKEVTVFHGKSPGGLAPQFHVFARG